MKKNLFQGIRTITDQARPCRRKWLNYMAFADSHYRRPASHFWRPNFAHPATGIRTFGDRISHIQRPAKSKERGISAS
jgi:hypothetical protein